MLLVIWAFGSAPVVADTLKLAYFNTELSRKGPGLLLRDILKGDAQTRAVAQVIAHVAPDVIVLGGVDFDHQNVALAALRDEVAKAGHSLPYMFSCRPNAGMATGLDLDGDGRLGEGEDAQGFGHFAGDGGLAVLSRYRLAEEDLRDFTPLLWRDLPGAMLPTDPAKPDRLFPSEAVYDVQRLSSTAHWILPVEIPGGRLDLMIWKAGPPVFDGPEDRNGRRNHDENRFWSLLLEGAFGPVPQDFVLLGGANLDPVDGDGRHEAILSLLADPRLQDPKPAGHGGVRDPAHRGNPALDTVDWPEDGPGNLRVDYVLPSATLNVVGAGVFWPAPDSNLHDLAATASRHRLVWVELDLGQRLGQ
ncbi:MAG: endonuclease [Rhodobacterales bacterium]|nr:MAG: endonuclease [Rhodobacterales bacterium]